MQENRVFFRDFSSRLLRFASSRRISPSMQEHDELVWVWLCFIFIENFFCVRRKIRKASKRKEDLFSGKQRRSIVKKKHFERFLKVKKPRIIQFLIFNWTMISTFPRCVMIFLVLSSIVSSQSEFLTLFFFLDQ